MSWTRVSVVSACPSCCVDLGLSDAPSPDGDSIIFVQVDGAEWPGWTMTTIRADGTNLSPAAGSGFMTGTHPRLRPIP